MSINSLRVQQLNKVEYTGGTVVYQMCRDIRVVDNDALLFAQELAKSKKAQLVVNYVILNYTWLGATRRFYDWVLPSLKEVEKELRKHNIPLVVTFENERFYTRKKFETMPAHIGAVVIDELPLRFMRKWKEQFVSNHSTVPLYEVDAHNCVPVWELSQKQEFAAHTIRRKVHEKLPLFLEECGKLSNHTANGNLLTTIQEVSWTEVSNLIICDESVTGIGEYVPGTVEGMKMLKKFLREKLPAYDTSRNDINSDGQSNLSPYIAHGNISRRRIILELIKHTKVHIEDAFDAVKNGSNGAMGSIAAFIEECVVRAEISENFCFYNTNYDSYEGFPEWAKVTLTKASTDTREYVYTFKEFRDAKTHDDIWNAAQLQMTTTGKMHGYMRMYWAKKILEWSKSPQEAMKIAVKLNDIYELDGRDSNGYVGCAWSIGGLHDRPWFGRPIFGAVRYMAESGVKKRGDVKAYVERWLKGKNGLFT
jgi:deoxyribodipyrimidine photo-lyase